MPRHHEDAEQAALFDWAAYYPELKWMHAIANGGYRNKKEAARLKRQGVKAGVADIFLPLPTDQHQGLYLEMKRRKQDGRSRVTDNQGDFLFAMTELGYKCVVCHGVDEAIQTIKEYARI